MPWLIGTRRGLAAISAVCSARNGIALSAVWLVLAGLLLQPLQAETLPETVERVEGSVLGIATFQPTRSPRIEYLATGFVVDDGRLVVTNRHAVPESLNDDQRERLVVVSGQGRDTVIRNARVVAQSREHDLALLHIASPSLPALELGSSDSVRVGEEVAFTGYPIGMILGLYPATHRATIAAWTPMVLPARSSGELDARRIRALRDDPPMVFQLDGTAYPGNSGSPLYRKHDGKVIGVINQTFVQGGREAAVERPSGITYAIPAEQIRPLIREYHSSGQ